MEKLFKRLSAMLLAAFLVISLIPAVSAAETADPFFGRSALADLPNGDDYKKAYDRIADCAEKRAESADLSDLSLTEEELDIIVQTYRNDPHGHFWLASEYSYSFDYHGNVYGYYPIYNSLAGSSAEELQKNRRIFDRAAEDLISTAGITPYMSDFEKERRIHDALITANDYRYGENAHNEFGALVEGGSVCQGYSLAFQYILRLVGIQAFSVTGSAAGGPHSWNAVLIDGSYYYTDVTWDDPVSPPSGNESDIFYSYFNVTEEEISADHTFDPTPFALPKCTSTAANYYAKNPHYVLSSSDLTAERVASLMKSGFVRLRIEGSVDAALSWYSENCGEVAVLAGFDLSYPTSVSYVSLNSEVHFMIYGTLIYEEPAMVPGDLDGDESISGADSYLLKRITVGLVEPTERQLICGDLNYDGSISGVDSNLLKRIIAGA